MKKSYLCTGLALACALGLSACGGDDDGQLPLGIQLYGITEKGLEISNKGGATVEVPKGSTYVFPDLVPVDSDYDITIVKKPANTDSCEIVNGKGNTGSYSPNNIAIVCVVTTYTLGGSVTGLTTEGLKINNGAHSVTILKDAKTFSMSKDEEKPGRVAAGVPYGLTILQHPAGAFCTIANPNGLMPAGKVNNITVSCTPTPTAA